MTSYTQKDIVNALSNFHEGVANANYALQLAGVGKAIDEVAFMFDRSVEVWRFIEAAVKIDGVKLFNVASDAVQTYPLKAAYNVQYYFLETPFGYRLELMDILSGVSPLHVALRSNRQGSSPDLVHYSFKCDTPTEYDEASKKLEAAEWYTAQTCHSTYGTFSYWLTSEGADYQMELDGHRWGSAAPDLYAYIKPRVNLRDTVANDARPYMTRKAGQ